MTIFSIYIVFSKNYYLVILPNYVKYYYNGLLNIIFLFLLGLRLNLYEYSCPLQPHGYTLITILQFKVFFHSSSPFFIVYALEIQFLQQISFRIHDHSSTMITCTLVMSEWSHHGVLAIGPIGTASSTLLSNSWNPQRDQLWACSFPCRWRQKQATSTKSCSFGCRWFSDQSPATSDYNFQSLFVLAIRIRNTATKPCNYNNALVFLKK